MAKRKAQQPDADGPASPKAGAKPADLPAGIDIPTPATQPKPARKPLGSSRQAPKDAGIGSEPHAAGAVAPTADTPARQKQKKRRKSSEPPAADTPAQQRGDGNAEPAAAATGVLAGHAQHGAAAADAAATRDPLSAEALQVLPHPTHCSSCGGCHLSLGCAATSVSGDMMSSCGGHAAFSQPGIVLSQTPLAHVAGTRGVLRPPGGAGAAAALPRPGRRPRQHQVHEEGGPRGREGRFPQAAQAGGHVLLVLITSSGGKRWRVLQHQELEEG